VSDAAPCRCNRQVSASAARGPADAQALHFARRSTSFEEARALVRQVDAARWALEVHRSSQPCAASVDIAQQLPKMIDRSAAHQPRLPRCRVHRLDDRAQAVSHVSGRAASTFQGSDERTAAS
jgi:hypothetical protein